MEFDLSKIYTVVNADELAVGDTVIVADDLASLRERVEAECTRGTYIGTLEDISGARDTYRFQVNEANWALAYLVSKGGLLKWTDLKVGDVIQKDYITCSVQAVDADPATSKHIYARSTWMSDEELTRWKKVTHVNDSDF